MVTKKDSLLTVAAFQEMLAFDHILRNEVYKQEGDKKMYF